MPKATRCRAAVARLRFYQKSKYSVARANLREYKAILNLVSVLRKNAPTKGCVIVAQRRGFEPPVSFQPTHDFQSCSLNHSDISAFYRLSMRFYTPESHIILLYFYKKGKRFCCVFEKFLFFFVCLVAIARRATFHKTCVHALLAFELRRKLPFLNSKSR